MNGDRLFEAIGEIDCDLVNNADTAKKGRIKPFKIVIAVAAALVLLIGGALGFSFSERLDFKTLVSRGIHGFYYTETIDAVLDLCKDKTVKKDIVNTVTLEEMYEAFGYGGPTAAKDIAHTYLNVVLADKNGFLKKNRFGDYYTVFKTVDGAYIYGIMKVTESAIIDGKEAIGILFDYSYCVYDSVLTKSAFDGVKVGETTKTEVFDLTGETRRRAEQVAHMPKNSHTPEQMLERYGYVPGQEIREGSMIDIVLKNMKLPVTRSFLTTTGVMTISFKYDETLGEHVVSSMEFKEGCPINPEDLI